MEIKKFKIYHEQLETEYGYDYQRELISISDTIESANALLHTLRDEEDVNLPEDEKKVEEIINQLVSLETQHISLLSELDRIEEKYEFYISKLD